MNTLPTIKSNLNNSEAIYAFCMWLSEYRSDVILSSYNYHDLILIFMCANNMDEIRKDFHKDIVFPK